jgi:2-polyprenyl-3-methyl-5-hydroxy-6-metoxy-1,4-benzoquinol methylase
MAVRVEPEPGFHPQRGPVRTGPRFSISQGLSGQACPGTVLRPVQRAKDLRAGRPGDDLGQRITEHNVQEFEMVLQRDWHSGYWPEDGPDLCMEDAQDRLFTLLVKHLPIAPMRILDVGCGLGMASLSLAQMGHKVTAITPEQFMIDCATKMNPHENIAYVMASFDQFVEEHGQECYDVVLFQESLQYLCPLEKVFAQAWSLLGPNGHILLCDEVRHDPNIATLTAVPLFQDVITAAYQERFYIKHKCLLGKQVRRTSDIILQRLEELLHAGRHDSTCSKQNMEDLIHGWRTQRQWHAKEEFDYAMLLLCKDALRFRKYRENDERIILPSFNRAFGVQRSEAHWNWKFKKNPYDNLLIAGAYAEQGRLAAHLSGYPCTLTDALAGEEHRVMHAGDILTMPQYRGKGRGPTSLLARITDFFSHAHCVGKHAFFYGFNTGNMRKMGERYLHFEYLRAVSCHVMNVEHLHRSTFRMLRSRLLGYRIQEAHSVDSEWDTFFEHVKAGYGLLIRRDRRYLQWRYLDCPDHNHVILALRKRQKLVGWSVFSQREKTLIWGDALFDPIHARNGRLLLHHAACRFFQGVERIEGWFPHTPSWWIAALEDIGFAAQREPHDLAPCCRFFDQSLNAQYLDRHLYYTMGDCDLF